MPRRFGPAWSTWPWLRIEGIAAEDLECRVARVRIVEARHFYFSLLRKNGQPAELRIVNGAHTWPVWESTIADAMRYVFASRPALQSLRRSRSRRKMSARIGKRPTDEDRHREHERAAAVSSSAKAAEFSPADNHESVQ